MRYYFKKDKNIYCQNLKAELDPDIVKALEFVEERTQKNPWNAQSLSCCFDKTFKVIALYVKHEIAGFSVIYDTVASTDILTIGVDPRFQGRSLGAFLLECTLREALKKKVLVCYLEVRRSNVIAQGLYKKFGFKVVGERKNYYRGINGEPDEDAFTMNNENVPATLAAFEMPEQEDISC